VGLISPGQLSFLLRASWDTLPTAVNLCRWHIQSNAKCTLCDSIQPTTAHILGGCPVQQWYTYHHNRVLHIVVSRLTTLFADHQDVRAVYAGFYFNESPQETIPSMVLITPYCPDLILYNSCSSLMGIIEVTCPLDSQKHIESAHCRKQLNNNLLSV